MFDITRYVPEPLRNRARWARSRISQAPTRRRVRNLVRANRPIWLNVGGGNSPGDRGWLTLDLSRGCDLCWDLGRGLPFPDESVERLYSSHTLEHFTRSEVLSVLAECRRILIPGGVLSVAVPDARIWIRAYVSEEAFDSGKYLNGYQIPCPYGRLDLVSFVAYMSGNHKYLFDDEVLLNVLRAAGFRDAHLREFDPTIDVPSRRCESLYAECRK